MPPLFQSKITIFLNSHKDFRNEIRKGLKIQAERNADLKLRLFFLIGESHFKHELAMEQSDNDDLIIGSFPDKYENLPLKTLLGYVTDLINFVDKNNISCSYMNQSLSRIKLNLKRIREEYLARNFANRKWAIFHDDDAFMNYNRFNRIAAATDGSQVDRIYCLGTLST